MNSTNNSKVFEEFKSCVGRECKQAGIHELKIRFIQKMGWFCESCKTSLIEQDLIEVTEIK